MGSEGEGNRGYCMAARRYEISLPVFQHEKGNFVPPRGHVMFYIF